MLSRRQNKRRIGCQPETRGRYYDTMNEVIDIDAAVEIAVDHTRARLVEQIEQIVFDRGGNFDDEVAAMVAARQPMLATYANTVRAWLLGRTNSAPLKFNNDGTAR